MGPGHIQLQTPHTTSPPTIPHAQKREKKGGGERREKKRRNRKQRYEGKNKIKNDC